MVSTPLKNISQLGLLFPIYGKPCSKPPTSFVSHTYFSGPRFSKSSNKQNWPDYTQKNVGWFYPHYTMPIIDPSWTTKSGKYCLTIISSTCNWLLSIWELAFWACKVVDWFGACPAHSRSQHFFPSRCCNCAVASIPCRNLSLWVKQTRQTFPQTN